MLDGMRAASKSFVGRALLALMMTAIVVSFAIFGIGDIFRGFGSGVVARVGSTDISAESLRFAYQTELQRLQRRARRAVTNDEARALGLDQQVLGRLVTEAALDGRVHALGLAMSDAAVARAISDDPGFKDAAGRFDQARFQDILRDNGYSERSFVRQQRAVYLRQDIAEALAAKLAPPRTLLAAIHRFRNETRSIDYMLLPPSAAGEIAAPDDKTLAAWFEAHKRAFSAPEYRKITTLAVTPALLANAGAVSDADATKLYDEVKAARYTTPERRDLRQVVANDDVARAVSEKIKAGASFDEAIAAQSLTATSLGLVRKDEIAAPAVAEAAFALPQGAASEPIKTPFGSAVVQAVRIEPAVVTPFADVAAALKNEIAASRAKKDVATLHDRIEDQRASGKSLVEAAKAAGLEARTIEAIDSTGRDRSGAAIEGLTGGADLLKAVFASDVGVDNETVPTADDGYVWYEVGAIDPARQRLLEEVRDKAVEKWREEETARKLAEKAAEIVKQVQDGGDFAAIAKSLSVEVKHDGAVKRAGSADLPANAVVGVFDAPNGGAGSASAPGGRLVFHVLDDVVPDFDPDAAEAKQAAEQMQQAFEQDLLAQYVQKIESDAGVSINRPAARAATGGAEQ